MLVVEPDVAVQGGLQIIGAVVEAMGSKHLRQASVEALDHAVGLRGLGPGQAIFDFRLILKLRRQ